MSDMTKEERAEQIRQCNEAISTYEWFLEDAKRRNDTNEVKFLQGQIQMTKREKVSLRKKTEFIPSAEEQLYFAMMGA